MKAGLKKNSFGGLYGQELDSGNLSFFPFLNLVKKRIVGKYSTVHMVLSFNYERMLCVYYFYIYWTYFSGFTNKLLETFNPNVIRKSFEFKQFFLVLPKRTMLKMDLILKI